MQLLAAAATALLAVSPGCSVRVEPVEPVGRVGSLGYPLTNRAARLLPNRGARLRLPRARPREPAGMAGVAALAAGCMATPGLADKVGPVPLQRSQTRKISL
jgi:hypothetical protein